MSCCCPLPSWAGGSAEEDAPPTERQERVNRYAEELRRERGLSADEEERRLEERLAELEAKHAEALRAGDAGRLADLEGAIADLERKLEVDAAAYTPEPRKSFIPSLGSIAVWKSTSASGAPDNSSLSHFSAMTLPCWLRRAVRNRHRHAIEQAFPHRSIGETGSFETPPPLRPQHSGETLDEVSGHVDARRSRRSRDSADE